MINHLWCDDVISVHIVLKIKIKKSIYVHIIQQLKIVENSNCDDGTRNKIYFKFSAYHPFDIKCLLISIINFIKTDVYRRSSSKQIWKQYFF